MTDRPRVIVCQGPPICRFEDDEAMEAMQKGCPWCKIDEFNPETGEWVTVQDVGRA